MDRPEATFVIIDECMRAATFRGETDRVRANRVAAYNSPISVFGRISPYLSGIVFLSPSDVCFPQYKHV